MSGRQPNSRTIDYVHYCTVGESPKDRSSTFQGQVSISGRAVCKLNLLHGADKSCHQFPSVLLQAQSRNCGILRPTVTDSCKCTRRTILAPTLREGQSKLTDNGHAYKLELLYGMVGRASDASKM